MVRADKPHCTGVILVAGSGSRMKSDVPKQYMELCGRPLMWYALNACEQSSIIDDYVVVTSPGDVAYVRDEILPRFDFVKVRDVIPGGDERYASVANAMYYLRTARGIKPDYIFVHDGARPMLTEKILKDTFECCLEARACVAAVRSKDTVRIVDDKGYAKMTPDRGSVWNMQTPQVFEADLIMDAYEKLMESIKELEAKGIAVTDDAGVVEQFSDVPVKMVEASYSNIKVTTPEDMITAAGFLGGHHE